MTKKKNWLVSVTALVLPIVVGIVSNKVTGMTTTPYPNQPPLIPPSQAFPIIWTILFVLMGIAFYQVINADVDSQIKKTAAAVFLLQLIFNFLWPVFFFRLRMCRAAFLVICILWFLIFLNVVIFYRIKKSAGFLLIPYLLWVGFAIYLNIGFCVLN